MTAPAALADPIWESLAAAETVHVDHGMRAAICRDVIVQKEDRDAMDEEVCALAVQLERKMLELLILLGLENDGAIPGTVAEDGMLWLDCRAATILQRVGTTGAENAGHLRERSRARWLEQQDLFRLWLDQTHAITPVRFAWVLASSLWLDLVKPRLAAALSPSITGREVTRTFVGIFSPMSTLQETKAGLELRGPGGRLAAFRGDELALEVPGDVLRRFADIHKLPAQRLLHFLVRRGWEQRYIEDKRLSTEIVIDGGWAGLAKLLGISGRKGAEDLRGAAEVLRHVFLKTATGYGGVFSYWYESEAPGRPARIRFQLLGPLKPGYVADDLRDLRGGAEKWLVPLPHRLPPFVAGPTTHAAQANLLLRAMLEFREQAQEVVERGAAVIDGRAWARMAGEAGLSEAKLPEVLERWQQGPEPFLVRVDGDRWTLGSALARELESIRSSGRKELTGVLLQRRRRADGDPNAGARRDGDPKGRGR